MSLPYAVLITGASRGLGRALSLKYAQEGYRVYAIARGQNALDALAQTSAEEGLSIITQSVDMQDAGQIDALVARIKAEGIPLKVVVHNASQLGSRIPLQDYDRDEYLSVMKTNSFGPLALTQGVLDLLAPDAVIQFVTSGVGIVGKAKWGAYSISKFALEGQAQIWAEELRARGVVVQIIDPGGMQTRMRAQAFPQEDPSKLLPPEQNTAPFFWLALNGGMESSGQRFKAQKFEIPQR